MDKTTIRHHGELTESDIRGWIERNAKGLLSDVPFTPDELDHVAMCLHHIFRWYNEGCPLGDFLTAVVSDKFSEACLRADSVNQKALCLYALFCANKIGADYREKANPRLSKGDQER